MPNTLHKSVLTTGDIARLLAVAPRTVSKWIDSGSLPGYRIPGGGDRRVLRENLVRFCQTHGLPCEDARTRVLIVSQDALLIEGLKARLDNSSVSVAANSFEAGALVQGMKPDCLVVDCSIGNTAEDICRAVRAQVPRVNILAILNSDTRLLDRSLVNETFRRPVDSALVAERVLSLVAEL